MPVRQHRQAEIMGPDGKKVEPGPHQDGVNGQMDSLAFPLGQPVAGAPRPSSGNDTRGIVDIAATPNSIRTVGEQILDSVRTSLARGDGQISVRLQPPELGTVTVRLQERGERLEGTVEVDRSDTRREIEQALPDVVRSLQDAGIQIRKLEVTGGDSSGQDLGRGLPQENAWSGQNGSGQSRDHLPASHMPWSQETATHPLSASEGAALAGHQDGTPPGRIDLLL